MKNRLLKITLAFLLSGVASSLSAQQTRAYFGLGGVFNTFQDARFSDVQFSQATIMPEIGFSYVSDKNYWHASANFFSFNYNFPNYDTIIFSNLSYNVRFGYLRKLKPSFFLGFNWDVLDYYKRQTAFLGNGGDAYKLSSDFYISGKYLWNVTEDWQFNFGLDLGLFTFINTEPSFSANFQQNIIDNGQVTFIDSDTKKPFKLQNMEFKPLWDQFNLRTMIELTYKRRLGLSYAWDLRTFSDNLGYTVTNARHMLTLRLNFINHLKN